MWLGCLPPYQSRVRSTTATLRSRIGNVVGKLKELAEPTTLVKVTADQLTGWTGKFVREAGERELHKRIVEANPAFELAR